MDGFFVLGFVLTMMPVEVPPSFSFLSLIDLSYTWGVG
jgi:hypothetical protein